MRFRAFVANTVLLVVSAILALIAGEFAVRHVAPQNLTGTWFVEAATGPYMVNKSAGSAQHQLGERMVRYAFAPPHLRAPVGAGRRKVLVLGDSFTFGLLLADQDTYVGRLQERCDRAYGTGAVGLLNAGIGGSGTADHLAFYEDFGSRAGADTILLFLNVDDIGRSLRSLAFRLDDASGALVRTDRPSGRTSIKTVLNSLPLYSAVLENSHLVQLARLAMLQSRFKTTDQAAAPLPLSTGEDRARSQRMGTALFARFARRAQENGHRLIVVTTGWHRFKSDDPNEPTTAFMSVAPALFARLGIPFVDISDRVYAGAGGDLSKITIPKDGHPNERGAELIAEATWDAIATYLK